MFRRVRIGVAMAALLAVIAPSSHAAAGAASADRIVFSRNRDLFTVAPDGSALRRLTDTARLDTLPAWSSDRRHIAFVRAPTTLVRIEAGGGNPTILFSAPPRFDRIDAVSWSPDHSRIAFSTAKVGGRASEFRTCGAVWIVGADGSGAHRIVSRQYAVTGLSWAPGGARLVASFEPLNGTSPCRGGLRAGIVRFQADGSRLRSLNAPLGTDPSWSPGGGRIIFRDWRRTCHACGEIWIMRSNGSHQHVVATPPGPAYLGVSVPRWSPTGRRIAMLAQRDGRFGLWISRADGSHLHRVLQRAGPLDW